MSAHEVFHFADLSEIRKKGMDLGLDLETSEDFSILAEPCRIGSKVAPNRFAVLPMEGCDSNPDGSPSELVCRRYDRFSSGGFGLIWWEANAVVEEGRANPLQMMLTEKTIPQFKRCLESSRETAEKRMGKQPVCILQLTHSGRYSRPHGETPLPMFPQHDPILDGRTGVKEGMEPVSDAYLDSLVSHYVDSARWAYEAGFDGVDIKSCHRYLLSELLASHTRSGKYGGSFENRTRLLLSIIKAVKAEVPSSFIIACRFNVFDAHPYPYGFGEDHEDFWKFDPTEPMALVKALVKEGVSLLSNSAGNPYYIYPQVTRPFDHSSMGIPTPDEHPLESISRLFLFSRMVQKAAGEVPVVGNGYTWLRQFAPYYGAANIKKGDVAFLGFGREAIAYPDAPADVLLHGGMVGSKCCVTCSGCTQMMRDHGKDGCIVRDSALYGPLYRAYRQAADAREGKK